jgi:hypothetical protein
VTVTFPAPAVSVSRCFPEIPRGQLKEILRGPADFAHGVFQFELVPEEIEPSNQKSR